MESNINPRRIKPQQIYLMFQYFAKLLDLEGKYTVYLTGCKNAQRITFWGEILEDKNLYWTFFQCNSIFYFLFAKSLFYNTF